jgi:hypothetical protein
MRDEKGHFIKGHIPWNKRKTNVYSESQLKKLSQYAKSGKTGMLGKEHSDETKRKMSKAQKGYKLSKETKRKLGDAAKERGAVPPKWWEDPEMKEKVLKKIKGDRTPRKCEACGKEMSLKNSELGKRKYCSKQCTDESKIGSKMKEETKKKISQALKGNNSPRWKGGPMEQTCEYCGKQFKVKRSEIRKGKGKYCSRSCSGSDKTGSKARNWQGGKTSEQLLIRSSKEYNKWSKSVKKRDKFTCQICGDNSGGNLHSNHILKSSDYPRIRLNLNNGITLCDSCHLGVVTNNEKSWYSYFVFNLKTRGFIKDDHIPNRIGGMAC